MRPATDGNSGARTASEDHGENDMKARARTVHRFRGSKAIGIIFDSDLAPERRS